MLLFTCRWERYKVCFLLVERPDCAEMRGGVLSHCYVSMISLYPIFVIPDLPSIYNAAVVIDAIYFNRHLGRPFWIVYVAR